MAENGSLNWTNSINYLDVDGNMCQNKFDIMKRRKRQTLLKEWAQSHGSKAATKAMIAGLPYFLAFFWICSEKVFLLQETNVDYL